MKRSDPTTSEDTRRNRPAKSTPGNSLAPGVYGTLLFIAIAGLADAVYLARVHLSATRTCGGGDGCSAALNSPWAEIAGIPVAALGAGMYLALACLSVRILQRRDTAAAHEPWLFILSAAGTAASVFFTVLQATVIDQWCPFCLLSAGLATAFFLLCLINCLKTGSLGTAVKRPEALWAGLPWVLLALALPPLVVLAVDQGPRPNRIAASDQIVAVIGTKRYTLGEVDQAIQGKLQQMDEHRYRLRKAFLEERLIAREATAQGITPEALLQQAVFSKVSVPEEALRRYIVENRSSLPAQITPAVARQIETRLRQDKTATVMMAYMAQLKAKQAADFSLPLPARQTIAANPRGGPEMGPADAAVTIIVFTDFQCPFCRRTHHALHALMERFPGKIRLLFRYFPLDSHGLAGQAAEQAWCAHQQGRFWPFADSVFAHPGRLSEEVLRDYVNKAGVTDMDAFNQCVQSGQGKKTVAIDIAEGKHLGVQGTPTLFINGRFFAGMPRDIDAVIQEELNSQKGQE